METAFGGASELCGPPVVNAAYDVRPNKVEHGTCRRKRRSPPAPAITVSYVGTAAIT